MAIFFIERKAHNIIDELQIDPLENIYNLEKLGQDKLQARIDWIIEKIIATNRGVKDSAITIAKYYNGYELSMPSWYMRLKGHDLVEKLKTVFEALSSYRDDYKMSEHLTTIMARSFPVVPNETVELLKRLSE